MTRSRTAPCLPVRALVSTVRIGLLGAVGMVAWGGAVAARQSPLQQAPVSVQEDADRTTHTRFQQKRAGVRIWGGEGILHQRQNGAQYLVTNPIGAEVLIPTQPSLGVAEALHIVASDLRLQGAFAKAPRVELVIVPETLRVHRLSGLPIQPGDRLNAIEVVEKTLGYRLAYFIQSAISNRLDGTLLANHLVEAHSGTILRSWDALETTTGQGNSQYSGPVALTTTLGSTGYELRDGDRGGNQTLDMNHTTDMTLAGAPYGDADNAWGDGLQYVVGAATTSANGQTAAVDAHFGTRVTWDFFQQVLGRNGIDGKGTPTRARVHFGTQYDNAFWWDECFCLTFGDGNRFKTLTPLDVVAHEFSHGVTFSSANLIYFGESGSLNEATSDILGTMVEFYARGAGASGASIPDTGGNWTLGEQLQTAAFNRPLRYMYQPSLDRVSPDAWSPSLGSLDVHYGSGPMNRCFYFLSQGATATGTTSSTYLPTGMTGLGNDQATRIWYRALTTYLTSSSNYLHARMASLRAATDLHGAGSAAVQAVRNAFAAINVGYASGEGDDLEPPTVAASVSGTTGNIDFTATAQDNTGVASLVYFVDQRRVGSSQVGGQKSATVNLRFDSQTLPKGDHLLTVAATDPVGNMAYSAPVPFHLTNAFYELLLQGDFELGSIFDGGIDTRHLAWEDPLGAITQSWPYQGLWCAELCGLGEANTQSIRQTVAIPAEARQAILSFWLEVYSEEPGDQVRDTFKVQVRSTAGDLLATVASYSNLDRCPALISTLPKRYYTEHQLDLSSYRGQTVQLWFEGQEDAAHVLPGVLPASHPRNQGSRSEPAPISGASSYAAGVGTTGFLLDKVSLRIGEAEDTQPPVAIAKSVRETFGDLELRAEVSDNLAIQRVDYLVDGQPVGSTLAGPHRLLFDSRTLPDGLHTFGVLATDLAGNRGTSAPVAFATDNTFSQLLKNPGFESGLVAWAFNHWGLCWYGYIGDSEVDTCVQTQTVYGVPVPATLSQAVSIPAEVNSARLRFAYLFESPSNPPDDSLKVQIWDANGTVKSTLATFTPPATGQDIGTAEVDLSSYRGQSFVLALAMNTMYLPEGGGLKGMLAVLNKVELVVEYPSRPNLLSQPVSQTVPLGGTATFAIQAGGSTPLAYQWRRNYAAIPGATQALFSLANVQPADAGYYDVQISNSLGLVTSNSATLTVNAPPGFTTQPLSQTQVQGGTATFAVVATGSGTLAYQWSKDGSDFPGATTATLTLTGITAGTAGSYACGVTNTLNGTTASALSAGATLAVNVPPSLITQPGDQTATLGSAVTFTVVATGAGTLTYQWTRDGQALSGATSASLTLGRVQASDAGRYACGVTNTLNGTVTSSTSTSATLVVNSPPSITVQPGPATVTAGGTATFSVTATGTSLAYQWQVNPGSGYTNVIATTATAATLVLPGASAGMNGYRYRVQVTGAAAPAALSDEVVLTVNTVPVLTLSPQAQTVIAPAPATFVVAATGTAPLSYQWQKGGVAIPGATAATYTTPATAVTDSGALYSVTVSNIAGSIQSTAVQLVVVAPITVTVAPQSATILTGGQVTCSASVAGTVNTAVTWAITAGGGTLTAGANGAITYTAPAMAGTATLTAYSQADGSKSAALVITIRSLDFSGDGVLDVLDLATLARAFGATPGSPNWNPAADLNGDGVVDAADLSLFLTGL